MTPEKQRIAIAEACGWKSFNGWWVRPDQLEDFHAGKAISYIPDYLHDLNAMHEAEKTMDDVQRRKFEMELNAHCEPAVDKWRCWRWHLIHATAAQRAEAFLRAIGKWEEA